MNHQNLINRLVARKLQAGGNAKAGCVPCFGSAQLPARGTNAARPAPRAETKP